MRLCRRHAVRVDDRVKAYAAGKKVVTYEQITFGRTRKASRRPEDSSRE